MSTCTKRTIAGITYVIAAFFAACCLFTAPVMAAEINVTTTVDELGDDDVCSLREAVINANENTAVYADCAAGESGDVAVDVIKVPDGVYPLTRCLGFDQQASYSSDSAECDDLDVYDDVIVQGASTDGTIIEIGDGIVPLGNWPNPFDSRIFDIHTDYLIRGDDFICELGPDQGVCEITTTFDANDLTLRYGHDYDGGALRASGDRGPCGGVPQVTLRRVKAYENEATFCGGAVYVNGNLTVEDSAIEGNTAGYCGGGGVYASGSYFCDPATVNISGTSVSSNNAHMGSGGGIQLYNTNTTIDKESSVDNNGAYYTGGGIANYHSNLVVRGSSVSGNHGVPYYYLPAVDDDDDDDSSDDDKEEKLFGPFEGGGIYNAFFDGIGKGNDDDDDDDSSDDDKDEEPNVVLVENSSVNNNTASVQGAGISNGHAIFGCVTDSSDDLVAACSVNPDISAQEVAPTLVGGYFTVRGSEVNGNTVTADIFEEFELETLGGIYLPMGGGIHHGPLAGTFNLESSTVADNTALFGGGIINRWIMNISDSTISSNSATFPEEFFYVDGAKVPGVSEEDEEHLLSLFFAAGGGIFNAAALDVTNSTISSNTTIGSGAGLFNITGPIYYLIWAYVNGHLDNLVEEEELYQLPDPGALLKNVTVTNNQIVEPEIPDEPEIRDILDGISFVGNGGGVATFTGEVTLRNSIVAGNIDELENFNYYFDEFKAEFEVESPTGSESPSFTPTFTPSFTPSETPTETPTASPTPEFENPFVPQPDYAPDCYAFPDILGALCYYAVTQNDILDVCEGLVPKVESERYNIIGDNTGCVPFQPAEEMIFDQVGTGDAPIDPVLGPLADNGGPTETHLLLLGSPAIDTANPTGALGSSAEDEDFACEDFDQRGVERPVDGDLDGEARCDVGAVEVEVDCFGDPTGDAVKDECGVCGGDGLSCKEVACEEVDITETLFSMDGTSDKHNRFLRRLSRRLAKNSGKKKAAKKLAAQADALYLENWTSTWSLPSVIKSDCQGGLTCVEVSNVGILEQFNANSKGLYVIGKKLIRKLKRYAGFSRVTRSKLTKKNKKLYDRALGASDQVPVASEQCS